jgi:hypothetical protein
MTGKRVFPRGYCSLRGAICFAFLIGIMSPTVFSLSAQAGLISAKAGVSLEPVEWTWAERPKQIDSTLPNILLFGDSITRGYYPKVVALLAGKANCYLFATSASAGDPRLLRQVNEYLDSNAVQFSVIHFNNGMHGWDYSPSEYAKGLSEIIRTFRAHEPNGKLVWASTTPLRFIDGASGNSVVNERNARALKIMNDSDIPIDDQNRLMASHDDLHDGNIHYTAIGGSVQAQKVVVILGAALDATSSTRPH